MATAATTDVPRTRRAAMGARLAEATVVVGILGIFVAYLAPTLDDRILEKHAFRQTQTAFTARVFHEDGIDLFHPKIPVLGEPFEIPFEFPLFQALASMVMDLGVADDTAMRVTSLLCFLLTALLLYGLVRHLAGPPSALAALVAFVMTPFALVWSRASMIEYLATAGAVGFTWALVVFRERGRPLPGALALLAGVVGMLVKPTTAIFWIAPALLYRPTEHAVVPARRHLWTAALVAVPIAAAVAWTLHADSIKAASPTTAWLTSAELRQWNFGTLDQRLTPHEWEVLFLRGLNLLWPTAIVLPFTAVAMARSRQWRLWLAIVVAAVAPPLIFANLYFAHDYYLAAVSPAVAALVGLGAGWIWARLPRRPVVLAAAALTGVLLVYAHLELGRTYWLRIHGGDEDPYVMPLAREIESLTEPDDLVAITGLDWMPAYLYYAHRWGHMVPPANDPFAYDLIHDQGYRHMVVWEPHEGIEYLSRWRWVGALGTKTYAIADTREQLEPASFVATDAAAVPSGRTLARDLEVRCGTPLQVPAGERGTWILFESPPSTARIGVDPELAPLPARSAVFVAPSLAEDGRVVVACDAAPSLRITRVVSAGLS